MEKAVRLVVFDLDGTLVDSKVDLANSVNHALGVFGYPVLPNETVYSYVGDGASMLIQRSLGADGKEILPFVLETFLAHYREHLLDTTGIDEGDQVRPTLDGDGVPGNTG